VEKSVQSLDFHQSSREMVERKSENKKEVQGINSEQQRSGEKGVEGETVEKAVWELTGAELSTHKNVVKEVAISVG